MRKTGSFIYFFGSVGLILLGIVLTAFIERNRSQASYNTEDIRARAGIPATLQMTARITSVNPTTGKVVVDSLHFSGSDSNDLGTWSMSVGPNINLLSLTAGKTIQVGVEANTFNIENRTFKALDARTLH